MSGPSIPGTGGISGMIPWLLVAELLCLKGQSLGELVRDRMVAYPASGEINSTLAEPTAAIARVEHAFFP